MSLLASGIFISIAFWLVFILVDENKREQITLWFHGLPKSIAENAATQFVINKPQIAFLFRHPSVFAALSLSVNSFLDLIEPPAWLLNAEPFEGALIRIIVTPPMVMLGAAASVILAWLVMPGLRNFLNSLGGQVPFEDPIADGISSKSGASKPSTSKIKTLELTRFLLSSAITFVGLCAAIALHLDSSPIVGIALVISVFTGSWYLVRTGLGAEHPYGSLSYIWIALAGILFDGYAAGGHLKLSKVTIIGSFYNVSAAALSALSYLNEKYTNDEDDRNDGEQRLSSTESQTPDIFWGQSKYAIKLSVSGLLLVAATIRSM